VGVTEDVLTMDFGGMALRLQKGGPVVRSPLERTGRLKEFCGNLDLFTFPTHSSILR